jgi:hypothetical protein
MFDVQRSDIDYYSQKGFHPLVSVWDSSVPLLKVCEYRRTDRAAAYRLAVKEVHAIEVPPGKVPVEVHRDPLDDAGIDGEHRPLHYGIQGIHDTDRAHKMLIKSKLADLCECIGEVKGA